MNQIKYQKYLQHLLSWARGMEQHYQFHIGSNLTRNRDDGQWYSRLNHLERSIEETIKRPYALQPDDILTFHRQADELYREALGMYQNSKFKTTKKVKEKCEHHNNKQLDIGMAPLNQVPIQSHPPQTKATFRALVDTIIPSTWGAVDFQLDDYLIMILDHHISIQERWDVKTVPLSTPTDVTLDVAATQLMTLKGMKHSPDFTVNTERGAFASLSHDERIEAIRLLENLQVDLNALPSPFRNNASLVKFIVTYVFQMVKFGYYSEWIAYGSTRFASPEDRVLERRPFTWDLVGYPGVSFGYRALRGFLVEEFNEKVE